MPNENESNEETVMNALTQTPNDTPSLAEASTWTPRVDVYENDEAFKLITDLPGVRAEDVQVQYEREVLSISATRPGRETGRVLLGDRRVPSYARRFRVAGVDAERIEADLHDGVLELTLPKSSTGRARQIPVRAS
jgi:HSP20 family protein